MRIASGYRPRKIFMRFHMRNTRWAILVAHRRAGKTVAAVNDLVERASRNTREDPRYAYIAPFLKQAKAIAWMYLKKAAAPYKPKISEAELYVELTALPNSPRITIYGADNPDSFRGLYFDGVVLDEYGNMLESTFVEVLLPALTDRRGWCVFMGTPNGPNHFRELFYKRKTDTSWMVEFLPVTTTRLIPEEDLAEMKRIMDPEQYAQEMLCSFEASVRGAIYARQMEDVEATMRVGKFPFQPHLPIHVIMDLGWRDATAMGFAQPLPDGILMGHAYEDSLKPISHYIDYIRKFFWHRGLRMGDVHLPHDAKAKSLQTGKSIIEVFKHNNIRPKLVPELNLLDGIAATRAGFDRWYFNEPETQQLVLALKSYHREYDEDKKVYLDEPVHDWSSHYSDMFRYANIVLDPKDLPAPGQRPRGVGPASYSFALNDIWDLRPQQSRRL